MTATRDLSSIARDLVMAALDGLVGRAGSNDATPGPVRLVADRWRSMSKEERDEVTKYVATVVESAIGAIPLVAAAASKRVRRTVKRKTTSAKQAVVNDATTGKKDNPDKRDKKNKKDKKGNKDKKGKKDKKRKKKHKKNKKKK